MVASDFEGLRGYGTLEYEGQVPIKPYSCCFSTVFQASVCIATYGMSVPSLHTESTDSVIEVPVRGRLLVNPLGALLFTDILYKLYFELHMLTLHMWPNK